MAYSSTNPPVPLLGTLTRSSTDAQTYPAPQLWAYRSTNSSTDVSVAGFFSNAFDLGMRVGDIVLGTKVTSHGTTTIGVYAGVLTSLSTAGAATVFSSSLAGST